VENVPALPLFLFLSVGAISVFSFVAVAVWADNRRREREAFYKSESLKKLYETQGSGATIIEFIREDEKISTRRRREAIKLGGLITTAVGIGLMCFLRVIERHEPAFTVGLIPLLVGVALLIHAYVLGPKE
jgi:hypothetical protein